MKNKKNLITLLIELIVALLIVGAVMAIEHSNFGSDKTLIQITSDGFFVSALITLGFGLLIFIADAGNFYALQYLGYSLRYNFKPNRDPNEKRKDYYNFILEKKAARKEKDNPQRKWDLLIVGGLMLALCIVFTVLFYL